MLACISLLQEREDRRNLGWSHTASPVGQYQKELAALVSQMPPSGPFLPFAPVRNYCAVYKCSRTLEMFAGISPS